MCVYLSYNLLIVESTSPWSSPIVLVLKPNSLVRLCVDYCKLNAEACPDEYYMPTLNEILERVGSCIVFSKLDLSKGLYLVLMEENSREKTAFVSSFGKYEIVSMPFRLKNVPAVFQCLIEKTLKGCREFAASYIDDVLIFSKTWGEHLIHVKKVFHALRKAGLIAKPS